MTNQKPRSKFFIVLLLLVIMAAGAAFAGVQYIQSRSDDQDSSTGTQAKSNEHLQSTQNISVEAMTYIKPEGWAKLSQESLEESAANSGIALPMTFENGQTGLPVASVTVRVVSAIPKNDKDLRDSSITELKKLSKFELLEDEKTELDGNNGQRFIYEFGESEKTKQVLTVVVHDQKTYFVLQSSDKEEFDKHLEDFEEVMSAIKFN